MTKVHTDQPEFSALFNSIHDMDVTPLRAVIDAELNRLHCELTVHIWDVVERHLASDTACNVVNRASDVAERYIKEALAGDDARMRDILGLSSYSAPSAPCLLVDGHYGRSGVLLRELVRRHADLIGNEAVRELSEEVRALRGEIDRLKTQLAEVG